MTTEIYSKKNAYPLHRSGPSVTNNYICHVEKLRIRSGSSMTLDYVNFFKGKPEFCSLAKSNRTLNWLPCVTNSIIFFSNPHIL